tara:strand:- start:3203 stop:4426 length:1224 start_codon:yes stop_codon:yes gene_type:complete
MSKSKISLLSACISTCISASTLLLSNSVAATTLASTNATQITTNDIELVSISAPLHKIEQKSLHFSQALAKNSTLSFAVKPYTSISDEYWLEVTGKQLNSGITLAITKPGALIRLSGKKSEDPTQVESIAIDPEQIELSQGQQILSKAFSQKVSQQQFATANIFPNSSAVELAQHLGRGEFKLKVNQALNSDERYLVNVKEKGSKHKLTLSIPSQTLIAKQNIMFDMTMSNSQGKLTNSKHNAHIKTPEGETIAVNYQEVNGKYSIKLPEMPANKNYGKLYELHIASQGNDKGLKVNRNGKVAFAIARPTAKMTSNIAVNLTHAMIELDIASEGRYEISAIISGVNKQGKEEQVMLSRSAHYLQPGLQQVNLDFDTQLLKTLQVLPPYQLSEMRLVDQSRMALLQQQ